MKKLALFVALVLLLSLFTGCHRSQATQQPTTEPATEPQEETFYCPAPLTESEFARLIPSKAEYWADFRFWSEDNPSAVYRYYGTYNGCGVMALRTQIPTTSEFVIGDYTFICDSRVINVFKDGLMISLGTAHAQGLLTDKDIEAIYNYHKQTEPELYKESGE